MEIIHRLWVDLVVRIVEPVSRSVSCPSPFPGGSCVESIVRPWNWSREQSRYSPAPPRNCSWCNVPYQHAVLLSFSHKGRVSFEILFLVVVKISCSRPCANHLRTNVLGWISVGLGFGTGRFRVDSLGLGGGSKHRLDQVEQERKVQQGTNADVRVLDSVAIHRIIRGLEIGEDQPGKHLIFRGLS